MTRHSTHRPLQRGTPSDGDFYTPAVPLTTFDASNRPAYDPPKDLAEEDSDFSDDEMQHRQPTHTVGIQSQQPLLQEHKEERAGSSEYVAARSDLVAGRNTIRDRHTTYEEAKDSTRQKYIYAGFCLLVSLISFVVQTETAVYIQHELKWNKAYCMLWLTHGSWSLLWPTQLLILRIKNAGLPWSIFWRRHKYLIKTTAQMVQHQDLKLSASKAAASPVRYMMKTTAFVTTFLTFAGASWYVAVDMTSASDLTAIYNCSAFFAYVFSILLLNDKLRSDKIVSVGMAIVGVLVVAYGDTEDTHPKSPGHSGGSTNPAPEAPPQNRLLGNLVIGIGSVLYGLYEVLYKRYACPPEGTAPHRGMIFATSFGSMIGLFTLTVLWIPLPILHFTGVEIFEMPTGKTAALLAISTLSNAIFSGAFLVLMSLTSPVLSSVAALLTIFLVAIVDWVLTGKPLSPAALIGGSLIIIAFVMLSWATYREMREHAAQRIEQEDKVFDDDEVAGDDLVVDGTSDYAGEDDDNIESPGYSRRRHRDS